MENATDDRTSGAVTRRTVIMAGGAIGVAGVIAACGGGGEAAPTSSAADTTAPPSPTGSADPTASPTADPTTAPPADALAPVSDIPVGGGQVFDGPRVVVTQPESGTINGFTAVCPHQGCLVTEVTNNEILCPCHGSLFSAVDGAVIRGPATQGLAAAAVQVVDGNVVLG